MAPCDGCYPKQLKCSMLSRPRARSPTVLLHCRVLVCAIFQVNKHQMCKSPLARTCLNLCERSKQTPATCIRAELTCVALDSAFEKITTLSYADCLVTPTPNLVHMLSTAAGCCCHGCGAGQLLDGWQLTYDIILAVFPRWPSAHRPWQGVPMLLKVFWLLRQQNTQQQNNSSSRTANSSSTTTDMDINLVL